MLTIVRYFSPVIQNSKDAPMCILSFEEARPNAMLHILRRRFGPPEA